MSGRKLINLAVGLPMTLMFFCFFSNATAQDRESPVGFMLQPEGQEFMEGMFLRPEELPSLTLVLHPLLLQPDEALLQQVEEALVFSEVGPITPDIQLLPLDIRNLKQFSAVTTFSREAKKCTTHRVCVVVKGVEVCYEYEVCEEGTGSDLFYEFSAIQNVTLQ